jgi:hypothetical protein
MKLSLIAYVWLYAHTIAATYIALLLFTFIWERT